MATGAPTRTPLEPRRFSIHLPRPVSIRVAAVALVAELAGAWIGVPIYAQDERPVVARDAAVAQEKDRIPRDVLLKALLVPEDKFETANRAAQQLALLPPDESSSATVVRNVVERLNRKPTGLVGRLAAPSFVEAIAAQGRFAVPELVRALQEGSHSDEASVTILASLGRIGPVAADAQVSLHTALKADSTDPPVRKVILVVLANIGDRSDGLVEQIRADFDDSNNGAAWRELSYLWVLSSIRPRGDWVDGRLLASLSPRLLDPKYLSDLKPPLHAMRAAAVLGLAQLNTEESRAIKELLAGAFERAIEQSSWAALDIGLALARRDSERNSEVLTRLLQELPHLRPDPSVAWSVFGIPLSVYPLIDNKSARSLAQIGRSHADSDIAGRAFGLLVAGGLASRSAVPMLLEFLRSDAAERRRINAAEVIEFIADASFITEIERSAQGASSQRIADELRTTLSTIQFDLK